MGEAPTPSLREDVRRSPCVVKSLVLALTAAGCCAFSALSPPRAEAACETKWHLSSRYTICRYGNSVNVQGFDISTGSFWTQNCTNSGGGYSQCNGIDSNGNFWACMYTPMGRQCF